MDFKKSYLSRTRIYEYVPLPQLSSAVHHCFLGIAKFVLRDTSLIVELKSLLKLKFQKRQSIMQTCYGQKECAGHRLYCYNLKIGYIFFFLHIGYPHAHRSKHCLNVKSFEMQHSLRLQYLFTVKCHSGLHSFMSKANPNTVKCLVSKSYFANIAVQNVNKLFVLCSWCKWSHFSNA